MVGVDGGRREGRGVGLHLEQDAYRLPGDGGQLLGAVQADRAALEGLPHRGPGNPSPAGQLGLGELLPLLPGRQGRGGRGGDLLAHPLLLQIAVKSLDVQRGDVLEPQVPDSLIDAHQTALVVCQGSGLKVEFAVFLHVAGRKIYKSDVPAVAPAAGLHLLLELDHLPGQLFFYLPGRQLGVGRPDRPAAYLPPVQPNAGRHCDAVALAPFFNGRHKKYLLLGIG